MASEGSGKGEYSWGWQPINDLVVMKIILNSRHDSWDNIFWDL
ncbi:hypothetical protein WAA20_10170 [Butyrivibrio fibrisolvens]